MDIEIIAVGRIKDRVFLQKIEEYAGRIRHDAKLAIVEIKDTGIEAEGAKILDHLKKEKAHVIALDERGRTCSSREFAVRLGSISKRTVFIIGGPDGLSDRVKEAADERLALSSMTFTHEMARMVLLEQVYRAISIQKNGRYHRD